MAKSSSQNDNDLMKDLWNDSKARSKVKDLVIVILSILSLVLVAGLIVISLNSQKIIKDMSIECNEKIAECNKKMLEMMTETEFVTEYTIDTDNQSMNTGNINVTK